LARTPIIIFVAFSVFSVIPLFFVTWGAFVPSFLSKKVTLKFVELAFTSAKTGVILRNSLELAAGSSVLALTIGTVYAGLVARTDIPGKLFFTSATTGRLIIPILGEAFSWILLLSPSIGLINVGAEDLLGTTHPIFNIFSMGGLILAGGIGATPFAFLVLEPAFLAMNSAYEESSRVAGVGRLRTALGVTLPLATPALVSAFLISFIGSLETLEYPLIIGTNARITTLSTEVYNLANASQYSLASAYGLFFIFVIVILLAGYLWATRRAYRFQTVGGRGSQRTVVELGRWRWPAFVLLLIPVILFLFMSLTVLTLVSLVKVYTVVGHANPFTSFTLANYEAVVKIPLFWEAFRNSIILSFGAGALTTILGAVMSYVLVKGKQRGRNILYFISNLPLAFPGVVYSIALLWTFLLIPLVNKYVYGTIWVMLVGLVVIFSPFTIRLISPGLTQLSDELDEAAAVAGSSWWRRFRGVTLPLLRASMINSFSYVMLNAFRELGAVALLYNASSILIIIIALSSYDNSGSLPQTAAIFVMMMLFSALVLVVTRVMSRQSLRMQTPV
jgi:iron(III) transport system permease protein